MPFSIQFIRKFYNFVLLINKPIINMSKKYSIRASRKSVAKEIAERLNDAGLTTKRGKAYTANQVYQVANESYRDENIERLLNEFLHETV